MYALLQDGRDADILLLAQTAHGRDAISGPEAACRYKFRNAIRDLKIERFLVNRPHTEQNSTTFTVYYTQFAPLRN